MTFSFEARLLDCSLKNFLVCSSSMNAFLIMISVVDQVRRWFSRCPNSCACVHSSLLSRASWCGWLPNLVCVAIPQEGEVAELQRKLQLCEARVGQAESDLLAARAEYEESREEGRRAGLASKVVISRARWQAANASADAEEAKEESERATFDVSSYKGEGTRRGDGGREVSEGSGG